MVTQRRAPVRFIQILLLTTLCTLALAGCTSFQNVDAGSYNAALKAGDDVRITTSDGKQHEFSITTINGTAIDGHGEHIAIADISALQVKKPDSTKNIWLAIGAVAAVAIAASSGGGGGGSSGGGGGY